MFTYQLKQKCQSLALPLSLDFDKPFWMKSEALAFKVSHVRTIRGNTMLTGITGIRLSGDQMQGLCRNSELTPESGVGRANKL